MHNNTMHNNTMHNKYRTLDIIVKYVSSSTILPNINCAHYSLRQRVSLYSLNLYGIFYFMVYSIFNPCVRIPKLPMYIPKAERSFDTHD